MKESLDTPNNKTELDKEYEHDQKAKFKIEDPELREAFEGLFEKSEKIEHQIGLNLINTRLWIDELSNKYQREITIDTVPDEEWEEFFSKYDMFWFMGIYTPSEASKNHAKIYADQYKYALPDIDPEHDVTASPFAIPGYSPNVHIAKDWSAWDKMAEKLNQRDKKVILDFVPNHTALDHPWAKEHPEYYISGTKEQYEAAKDFYYPVVANDGQTYYLAHGKDPNYPEWADTLQLNYATEAVQERMREVLIDLVGHADGVRCDMAMLLNSDTFIRTWGWRLSEEEKKYIREHDFWANVIPTVKSEAKERGKKDFYFIAEAYWDKDRLGQHFDFIYGKDFYDHVKRIVKEEISPESLMPHMQYLVNLANTGRHYKDVLFIENHDEERAVETFGSKASMAASVLAGLVPNSIFLINQGQEKGSRIRPPMQTNRWPKESSDAQIEAHYEKLLFLKHTNLLQNGSWQIVPIDTASPSIQAMQVSEKISKKYELGATILVNFSKNDASCRVPSIGTESQIEVQSFSGEVIRNPDMERSGGLYVGLKPWETQIVFYKKAL